jgi:diadenosine tetraphosphate (Ap4A) HIT family hydrolase
MENCIGCEIISGGLTPPGGFIHNGEQWTLTHSIAPGGAPLRGMLILQTRRHCTQLADLTPQESRALGPLLQVTCRALEELFQPARVYAGSFGEGVPHVHFMLIPRLDGMPIGAELLKQVLEQHLWTCPADEAAALAAQVREKLRNVL